MNPLEGENVNEGPDLDDLAQIMATFARDYVGVIQAFAAQCPASFEDL